MGRFPRYCPRCSEPLRRLRARPGDEIRPACPACGFVHFDNPAPCAGVLVVNERGEVLLGRRQRAPFRGWWGMLGGFVEGREHPEETARREMLEEIGARVRLDRLLGIWTDRYGRTGDYTVSLVYIGTLLDPEVRPGDDVAELRWFAPDALPRRIAFRSGRAAVLAWAMTAR